MAGCMKCGHEREPNDPGPLTACPKCGAIYAKVAAAVKGGAALRDASGRLVAPIEPVPPAPAHSPAAAAPIPSALTGCRTCGKPVSRTAKACPHCGEESPAQSPPAAATPVRAPAPGVRKGFWYWLAMVLGAMFLLSKCSSTATTASVAEPDRFDRFDAFELCKRAIRLAARDGDTAVIPDVPAVGAYSFAWDITTQRLRLRNGLGLEVPAAANCTVDPQTKSVSRLSLNGQVVWQR